MDAKPSFVARLLTPLRVLAERWHLHPLQVGALFLFAPVLFLNPAKLPLLLWGAAKVFFFGHLGSIVDSTTSKTRPEQLEGISRGAAEKRRAWIIGFAMLAGALLP